MTCPICGLPIPPPYRRNAPPRKTCGDRLCVSARKNAVMHDFLTRPPKSRKAMPGAKKFKGGVG